MEDHVRRWKPTIQKRVPRITSDDPNYNKYKELSIFQYYQQLQNEYNLLLKEVRTKCSSIKIKKYDAFLTDDHSECVIKAKAIIGISPEFKVLDKQCQEKIYSIACEFGHLHIVNDYIAFKQGKLSQFEIEKAKHSHNVEISKKVVSISLKKK